MAVATKLNYEELEALVKQIKSEEEEIKNLMNQTKSKVEALHNNQWVGQAADKFFSEMESEVLPKEAKMVYALETAAGVLNQIIQIIKSADEETKGFFGSLVS